jgi:3-oxoadipate enol-lactonase
MKAPRGAAQNVRAGEDAGQRTIVFVNSLATTGAMWDRLVAEMPEGWRALRYDQRDRGGPRGGEPFSLDDLVADLMAVLDESGVSRAHVVGVSLGGLVGLRAAAMRPERIRTLTAMCCASRFRPEVWVQRAAAVRRQGVAPLIPGIIDRWFTPEFQADNDELVAAFRDMLASTDDVGYAFASDVLATADVGADLPSISVPTLVLGGERDAANPPADLEAIARAVPGARLEILPDVAHLAPVAAPARIAHLIIEHASAHAS